ncbi:MAG: ArsB/NhaD family transporter [Bdellovibrionales bacterium]|nr:ArsB/NhaD family transporter [Bdellovibrionales bacterium]
MSDALVVSLVFISIFAGIISEKLDKTLIVLVGAAFLIVAGYISFENAIHAIDFDTIVLLMGMMLLVDSLRDLKLFEWIALKLGIVSRGNPVLIFLMFNIATAVASAFLDNVTTVLIMVPLTISLTQGIGLPPKMFILSVIFMSNIGGAATLIGDPPNILIGSQVKSLTFANFIEFLSPAAALCVVVAMWFIRKNNKAIIRSRNGDFQWLFISKLMLEQMKRQLDELHIPRKVFIKSVSVFALVLLGFFTHALTHIEPAIVAISGAVVMMVVFHKDLDLHHLVPKIEWLTLLFFSGLFICVGAMEHAGVLKIIAHTLVSMTDNVFVMLMIILWASAVFSAIVDNIPFVAVMIPIIKDLLVSEPFHSHPKAYLLWWALALGACLGGNGSQIGASANVVSSAIARSKGIPIGFKEFAKESIPVTLITIVVCTAYLSALYYW